MPHSDEVARSARDVVFKDEAHSWATGIISGTLMASRELRVSPVTNIEGTRFLPEVHVTIADRSYVVLIEELQ